MPANRANRPEVLDTVSDYRQNRAITDTPPIKIAHVSDLHFIDIAFPKWVTHHLRRHSLGDHNPDVLEALRSKIRQLSPDIVIASGDFATFGDHKSVKAAFGFLSHLTTQDCRLSVDRLINIPGNHDSLLKYLGFVRDRSFDRIIAPIPMVQEYLIRDVPIMIFRFDSSIARKGEWWPFTTSKGRIEAGTFTEFNNKVFDLTQRDSQRFERALKIAVVHHHPLPVPNKEFRSLTVMQNGGTFIAHMQSSGVNLVLHGHEHFPYSCSYRYDQGRGSTIIVSAGTACQNGSATNSFSFIEFHPWTKLKLRQFDHRSEAGFSENFNGSSTFWFRDQF